MLQASDLADLAFCLRRHDFVITNAQLIAAGRLVGGTRRLETPAQLAAYLAPIFCGDPQQQADFGGIFTGWLARREGCLPVLPAERVQEVVAPVPAAEPLPMANTRGKRWRGTGLAAAVLLALGLILAGYLFYQHPESIREFIFGEQLLPELEANMPTVPPAAPTPTPTPTPATVEVQRKPEVLPVAQASVVMPTAAAPPKPTPPSKTAYRLNWLPLALLAGLLAIAGLWWLVSSQRRRAFLHRLPANRKHDSKRLRSAGARPHNLLVSDVRQLGIELRRRHTLPSRAMDVEASIAATLRAGGQPRLVLGSRAEAEYLVLVDRASRGDHQARWADEILAALSDQGVAIERYLFDADPRRARHAPLHGAVLHPGPQSLETLASRHGGARLLIFSDGRGFIDPYTGRVAAWLPVFGAWAQPVMLTAQARERWGLREWLLAQGGLVLLPLCGAGMQILGQLFADARNLPGVDNGARGRARPAYLQDVDVLLDRIAPSAELVASLLQALETDLHDTGMAWLGGCAVYPELHWGITLALGETLLPEPRAYTECLAQMVRLPWLRAGFMPDWLRAALLERLQGTDEQTVRASLNGFLATLVEDRVPAAGHEGREGRDRLLVATGKPAGTWPRWRAWPIADGLPEAANDKVFLQFMSGARPRLALDAGSRLQQLLYRHGAPLAGPRALPLLVTLALAAALGAGMPPVTVSQETEAPVLIAQVDAKPPQPPLTASVPQAVSASASAAVDLVAASASAQTPPVVPPAPVAAASASSASSAPSLPSASAAGVVASASASAQAPPVVPVVPQVPVAAATALAVSSTPGLPSALAIAVAAPASVPSASAVAANDGKTVRATGAVFQDALAGGGDGPPMVVIPAGGFLMGSPASEKGRYGDEGPQHQVNIAAAFALGQTPVTFDEWDACVKGGGCGGYAPNDQGWGRGARPVINVSWDDAQQYVAWLSKQTGKSYRLPSEAEWEYAARAGTTTAYYWGDDIGKNHANCRDCGSQWDRKQTAPVGSFAQNGFGLRDMAGNVYQWTQDCRHKDYSGSPPVDGGEWVMSNCQSNERVLRGGSWFSYPVNLRAANRSINTAASRLNDVGLRVARTLP